MNSLANEISPQEAFGQRLIEMLNHAGLTLMISLGHRAQLFDTLARHAKVTSAQLAQAGGLNERYVREWLGAMTTGGIVEYDPSSQSYHLPEAHAAWLTRAASPQNLAGSMQWIGLMGQVEDEILAAFKHGKGVPYAAYRRFHEVMAEESDQTVVAPLLEHILPLVPGLIAHLESGVDVLDIGCGSGRALIKMASHFPQSRFVGFDASPEAISTATESACHTGLTNVRFQVQDAAEIHDVNRFDLITAFDAIHDQARPEDVLNCIHRALKDVATACFLMQDISGSGHVHQDMEHPLGPFLYTISCMHCMSVSLAANGPGLGAMWGRELALKMLKEAGFKKVQVHSLEHDPMNFYYIAHK